MPETPVRPVSSEHRQPGGAPRGTACIWMQSGAVARKTCTNHFDCPSCTYDRALGNQVRRGRREGWPAAMRRKTGRQRACRHSLAGRAPQRTCPLHYHCERCGFDQMVEEVLGVRLPPPSAPAERVRGFSVPPDCAFHPGHAWVRVESGGYLRVGLDAFGARVLGPPDDLDLPRMGAVLHRGRPAFTLRRSGHRAALRAPLSGTVEAVNHRAALDPGLLSRAPFEDGWVVVVRVPDPVAALDHLTPHPASRDWMAAEVDRLEALVEATAGPLAADGGHLADDLFGRMPELGWERLVHTFFERD